MGRRRRGSPSRPPLREARRQREGPPPLKEGLGGPVVGRFVTVPLLARLDVERQEMLKKADRDYGFLRMDRIDGRKIYNSGKLYAGDLMVAESTGLFISIPYMKFAELKQAEDEREAAKKALASQ